MVMGEGARGLGIVVELGQDKRGWRARAGPRDALFGDAAGAPLQSRQCAALLEAGLVAAWARTLHVALAGGALDSRLPGSRWSPLFGSGSAPAGSSGVRLCSPRTFGRGRACSSSPGWSACGR